jgi:hypothetical protein
VVEFGQTSGLGSSRSDATLVTSHAMNVRLKRGYWYVRVVSRANNGTTVTSEIQRIYIR